jgi:hypothetical protein
MTNISTGKVTDRARARVEIHSAGDSKTAIKLGAVSGDGSLDLLVFDQAHGYEPAKLESQLWTLEGEISGNSMTEQKASHGVRAAREALTQGDHNGVARALRSAGTVALSMAKTIGAAVAEKAIEAALKMGS